MDLIVVLSIFGIMSAVVMSNYGAFQDKIDIKNLSNDIALKIVESQKSAMSGKQLPLALQTLVVLGWKPSFGVYFNSSVGADINSGTSFNKEFIFFTDLNQNNLLDNPDCVGATGECMNRIIITKNNYISGTDICTDEGGVSCSTKASITNPFSITFTRPDSSAIFKYSDASPFVVSGSSYVRITVTSPKAATAFIKIYPSGRIQIN